MTDNKTQTTPSSQQVGTRRARIETSHGSPETATQIVRAIRPDNTAEMKTRQEATRVVTTIQRETTGGLQSNLDDYLVNLDLAAQLVTQDREPSTRADDTPSSTESTTQDT